MSFPYGKAPLALLTVAIVTGAILAATRGRQSAYEPDLVFMIFAPNHVEAYEEVVAEFEREHGVDVDIQLVSSRALTSRLQAALMTGAPVPDLVEILNGTMGYYTRGPLQDVGFVDLTDRLHDEGLYDRIVESRFSLWSSRGRVFALPHDVHPVMLCYRRDLVEELGIDVSTLTTWDEFARVGREITTDLDGDGNPDRYMLDLNHGGGMLPTLLLQRGVGLFDADGNVAFDVPEAADVIMWHIRQTRGPGRITFEAGWGQGLTKTMIDGLCLFYFCPDWRTKQFEMDIAALDGKLALMPLPAWEAGARRTSTWGGTGLCITKACRNQELAWALAKKLYFDKDELGARFKASNIIPPFQDAWNLPEFQEQRPFFSNQPVGALFAALAPSTPPDYASPYLSLARTKLSEAFLNAVDRFEKHGEDGLREYTISELKRCADYVRRVSERNVFLREEMEARP